MKKQECNKIPFFTESEARAELVRIVEGNDYRGWKQKTPTRLYICGECSQKGKKVWHLTSQPTVTKYR